MTAAERYASTPRRPTRCVECGKEWTPRSPGKVRFCSRTCAGLQRRHRNWLPCLTCGTAFPPGRGRSNGRGGRKDPKRFCSDACARRFPNGKCPECGSPVLGVQSRYCSTTCQRADHDRRQTVLRKARERNAVRERVDPMVVFRRDGWVCRLCGRPTLPLYRGTNHPEAPELDHVVPLSRGGPHLSSNLQCAHRACNLRKSNRMVVAIGA